MEEWCTFQRYPVSLTQEFQDRKKHFDKCGLCVVKVEEVDNKVLLAAFQEKKKMMEEKMPKGSGSQRLFQQVPHQFCNAVCRVGFHRLYSTHNGRYRACPWGLSVFRACPWGLSSGLPTCAQASRHQWMAVGRILHPWASETKSFRNGHSFVFSVFCLWAILGCDYGQQDLWFWFFSPFCFCVWGSEADNRCLPLLLLTVV